MQMFPSEDNLKSCVSQAHVGEYVRVELQQHPAGERTWKAHRIHSVDVGELMSVKTGSDGVVEVRHSLFCFDQRPHKTKYNLWSGKLC
jgi:hypothetical protein